MTGPATPPAPPSPVRRLAGADAILAVHGPALPQPDQQCGPFAAWAALHAVLPDPPSVTDLAVAAGTRIWPHDLPQWRPSGAPLDRSGWDVLPQAPTIELSGTDATGLARGLARVVPTIGVIPARGPGDTGALLHDLVELGRPAGVVANLRTGPVAPDGSRWDVGHFVVLWGVRDGGVAIADTYAELGAHGLPPGCRVVSDHDLDRATADRGLLVLVASRDVDVVRAAVARARFRDATWTT